MNVFFSFTVPLPEHKTPADYIEGLFPLELKMRVEPMESKAHHNGMHSNFSDSSSPVPEEYNEAGKGGQPRVSSSCSGSSSSSSSSSPTPAQNGSRKESEEETVRKR